MSEERGHEMTGAGSGWAGEETASEQLAGAVAEAREALTRYDEAPETSIVPCCEHAEELAGALRDLLAVVDGQGGGEVTGEASR